MKDIKILLYIYLVLSFFVGCSDVEFKSLPRCGGEADNCVELMGFANYRYEVKMGSVDILIVNDNSGSMSTEQSKMAQGFGNFEDTLNIKNIDYRLAVITTDISNSEDNAPKLANGNGLFQDGQFLISSNGYDVLSPETPNVQNEFSDIIQRQETLDCEASGYKKDMCPSMYERGIYAANLALDRLDTRLFRPKSNLLAIAIVSDEDENGKGTHFDDYDYAETLVAKVGEKLGTDKMLGVYPIIIRPGDKDCKSIQDNQGNKQIYGQYGTEYARLVNSNSDFKSYGNLIDGYLGNICDSNYGDQLSVIAHDISTESERPQLPCTPATKDSLPSDFPKADPLEIFVNGTKLDSSFYSVDGENRVTFKPSLPAGTVPYFDVVCAR